MAHVSFFSGKQIPLEMHKVRIVQKLSLLPVEQRLQAMAGQGTAAEWAVRVAGSDFAAIAARVGALAVPPQQLAAAPQVGEAH